MANFSINLDNESSKRVGSKTAPLWYQKRCRTKSLFDAGFRLKNSPDTVLGVEKFSSISKYGYIKSYSLQGQ